MHDDDHPLARAYHRLLVWEIMKRPASMRLADRALNPLIGKSIVVYATKPAVAAGASRDGPSRKMATTTPATVAPTTTAGSPRGGRARAA